MELLAMTRARQTMQERAVLQPMRERLRAEQAHMAWRIHVWPTDQRLFQLLFSSLHRLSEQYIRDSGRPVILEERLFQTKPWLLPGLSTAPDGKSLACFFIVKPEWNVVNGAPLQRRCQDDCWQELAGQVASFGLLDVGIHDFRPLRRTFCVRGLGAQEGVWKMYEYALESNAAMFEREKRTGRPMWVVYKIVRDGSLSPQERQERASSA